MATDGISYIRLQSFIPGTAIQPHFSQQWYAHHVPTSARNERYTLNSHTHTHSCIAQLCKPQRLAAWCTLGRGEGCAGFIRRPCCNHTVAVGSPDLAVDGANRMRFARLVSIALPLVQVDSRIGLSASRLDLRMVTIGGRLTCARTFGSLLRPACNSLDGQPRCSMAGRGLLRLACWMITRSVPQNRALLALDAGGCTV